jgi:D-alanyl-D-alanine carboxypeptidase/D-alanyl-D-alanine-endopeptidase (penicillin-binding protein 4)
VQRAPERLTVLGLGDPNAAEAILPVSTSVPPTGTALPSAVRRAALAASVALVLAPVALGHPASAAPVVRDPVAGVTSTSAAPSQARLTSRLSSILDDSRSRKETDVSVLDAQTGAVVYARRATSTCIAATAVRILVFEAG